MTTHGMTNTRIYNTWKCLFSRCGKHRSYKNIEISERWKKFENFYEDMNPTYSDDLTIDRIDNDKGYCIENCRWATKTTQARNRGKNRNNKSGYKGVSKFGANTKRKKKYAVEIMVDYKRIRLGYFLTAIDGAKAYDEYIIENDLEHTRNFR